MKKLWYIIIVWACVLSQAQTSFAQLSTYQFEQIDSLQKVEKRNTVVFIHTDWCKFCQAMQNTTFKNDSIIKLLSEKFYFIDLNAEEHRNISFQGQTLKYIPTGTNTGIHELAEQLATIDNKVAYPTLCILNADKEIVFQYNQFINAKVLHTILTRLK
jgi:thioredoxin-related protein